MNKIVSAAIAVGVSVLFLSGCTSGTQAPGKDSGGKETTASISLDSTVKIDGILTVEIDESKLPKGWKVEPLVEGDGFATPEEGTAIDLSNSENSCFFYTRTEPEIVQTQQVSLGDSFLTISNLAPYLTVMGDEQEAEKLDNMAVESSDGASVEIATVKRFEGKSVIEIPDENGNLVATEVNGQNLILGKRLFAVNAEKYEIPADLISEEMAGAPQQDLSSIPAFTAVLQCQNKDDVSTDTFKEILGLIKLQNITKKS